MDYKQIGFGVLTFVVFWAFQAGYFNFLGPTSWFLSAVAFIVLLWLIGQSYGKEFSSNKILWNYAIGFALVVALLVSYAAPYIPGIVLPPDSSIVPPILLSFWLVLFGATMFVGAWNSKIPLMMLTGVIWLFSSFTWVLNSGPNAYLHFAIVASLPFILTGFLEKG